MLAAVGPARVNKACGCFVGFFFLKTPLLVTPGIEDCSLSAAGTAGDDLSNCDIPPVDG